MKKIGVFIILVVLFIPKAYAATYITTNKTNVSLEETFEINVNVSNVTAWDINVFSTENASNCTISEKDSSDSGTDKTFTTTCQAIGPGTIIVSLNGSITIDSTDENNENTNEDTENNETNNETTENEVIALNESIEIEVEEVTPDNNEPKGLSSLTVEGGILYPSFDPELNTGYRIVINSYDTSTFSIRTLAKETDDSVTIKREVNGIYELVDPNNIEFVTSGGNNSMLLEISVGSGSRLVKYNIIVSKQQPDEIADPELKTLKIGKKDVTLIPGNYEYTVELDDDDIEADGTYKVNATLNDDEVYEFNSSFIPNDATTSGQNFAIEINPKSPNNGLKSVTYIINVKTSVINPVTSSSNKTTTKQSGGNGGGGNNQKNPVTGSRTSYVVGIILILSVIASLYLYKKNINGYN